MSNPLSLRGPLCCLLALLLAACAGQPVSTSVDGALGQDVTREQLLDGSLLGLVSQL